MNETITITIEMLEKLTSRQILLLIYIRKRKIKGSYLLDLADLEEYLGLSTPATYRELKVLINNEYLTKTNKRNIYA